MSPHVHPTRGLLALLAALQLTGPSLTHAQLPVATTSGVIGRIFDERTNEVLVDVLIFLDATRREIPVSSHGRFVLSNMAPGKHRLEVRAIGYRPHVMDLNLTPGQILERQFAMIFTGDRLPELAVESRNS